METSAASPTIICRRASQPLNAGALLEAAAWQEAEVFRQFFRLRQHATEVLAPPQFPTTLRTLWDDERLYVRFDCESPDVWATRTRRDDELWEDPVVEVFLDPLGQGQSFFEFQVNPLGTIYDSFVADAAQSADWQRWCRWNCAGLSVEVRVDGKLNDRSQQDKGWSAVMAIPFADLARAMPAARPSRGATWRANFTRYERARLLPEPELTAAAPVVKVFDDLPRFASLRFVD